MNKKDKPVYEARLKVPFHDADPMQVVWHGNYIKYFEIARDGLLDEAGVDLQSFFNNTKYLFPVIKTSTKHIFPLRHRDEFICKATLLEAKFKIVFEFEIRLVKDNKLCAKGKSEQAAVKYPEMEILFNIPEQIQKALGLNNE
ncbi:MAG: acyl-CoA thioesterase [Spirochaetes bacterium]|nr:acyl-CoA thioesterase [Spirochaetota bacterium]